MAENIEGEEQEALFKIEGPDEDGCVWAVFNDGEVLNLGPRGPVAETLIAWLSQQDYGERPEDWAGLDQPPGYDDHADPGDFGVKQGG